MNIRDLRDANAKTTQMLVGRGIRVTQRGSNAYVAMDPSTHQPIRINVPFLPDDAPAALIRASQGYMDHEAGHILFTDWLVRAEAEREGLATSHNIVEDCYVERAMAACFPGSGSNLEDLHELFTTEITPGLLGRSDGSEVRAFEILIVPAARALAGQGRFVAFMDEGGHWRRPSLRAFVEAFGPSSCARMPKLQSSSECLEVARLFSAASRKAREVAEAADGEITSHPSNRSQAREGTRASGDEAAGETAPGAEPGGAPSITNGNTEAGTRDQARRTDGSAGNGGARGPGQADARGVGDPRSGDPDGGVGSRSGPAADRNQGGGERGEGAARDHAPIQQAEHGDWASGVRQFEDPFAATVAEAISARAGDAIAGARYRVFTRDHDRVEVLPVEEQAFDNEWLRRLDDAVSEQVGTLQRNLERTMAARSASSMLAGRTSGRLHAGALHRLATGDARVFRRKQVVASMDTALSLLIDNSGSMRGEKMLLAMMAGYALTHSAERVGIPCECIGFTTAAMPEVETQGVSACGKVSYSRIQPLYLPIYKQFDERMRLHVRRRFAAAAMAQAFCASNIDGECVAIASARLLGRREARKILLVLSDGQPAGGRGEDLRLHLHATVAAATKAGIELVGIGIGDDAVTSFYPRSFVLDDMAQLPEALLDELRGAMVKNRSPSARPGKSPRRGKPRGAGQ